MQNNIMSFKQGVMNNKINTVYQQDKLQYIDIAPFPFLSYQNCTHVNSELMTCPTPNITEPEIFQDGGSQEALQIDDFRSGRRRRRQTSEEEPRPINGPDLEYYVRFQLDGAGDGGRGRNISVFMDPEFNEFRDDLTIKYYLPSRHEHLFIRVRRSIGPTSL